MILTLSNLETQPWLTQIGLTINPVPADSFTAALLPGSLLKVVNTSSKAWGGGLVACKPNIAPFNIAALPYSGLDAEVYVSPADMANLGRLELDLKRCIVTGKVGDFSGQLNLSTGSFQISPNWKDSGFYPILPSAWTKLRFRHYMTATAYSFLSAKWGGSEFEVSPADQGQLLLSEAWENVCAVQIQTEILVPGEVTIYLRNITLSLSDEPIA
jgi:hypothetical protein